MENKQYCNNCNKDLEFWTPVVVTHCYGSERDAERHIFCSTKCCSEYYENDDRVKAQVKESYNDGYFQALSDHDILYGDSVDNFLYNMKRVEKETDDKAEGE
jgi:heterodisulfide reductase subunit A-like polyferredoxin